MKDYYEILEVHPKASPEVIKKAYQTLAKKYHPDTTLLDKAFAEQKMAEINEAYAVLSDAGRRKSYDQEYFAAGTTTESKSQTAASRSAQASAGYDDSLERTPAAQFILNLGHEVLQELNTNIVRKTGNEQKNRAVCDRLDVELESNLVPALKVINDSSGYKKNIYYLVGLVYWQMASAYTWTDNRQGPLKYIALADKYIAKDFDYYDKYQKTRQAVNYNEQVEKSNDAEKKKERNGCLIRIVIVAIIIAALYLFGGGKFSNKSNTNKPHSTTQTQQNRSRSQSNQQRTDEKPIPQSGVSTGYDKKHAVLNNDGFSSLTIDNSRNDMPVYVRVWDLSTGKPVRAFYIRQGEEFTAEDITTGNYEVRYKELYENNVKAKANKSEPLLLIDWTIGNTTHYSNMTLTLYKVRNGNTHTTAIDENEV